MALRAAILRHVRVPLQASPKLQPWNGSIRSMSSHDDHLTKEEVVDRVLSVVKDFPKVDPSKECERCEMCIPNCYSVDLAKVVFRKFE
ncbi:acyl carrier protein mitochondrial-like, partial [Trifolium medium]|nr:acyl carrier protein mitochondrial-like [Trifolium medium]